MDRAREVQERLRRTPEIQRQLALAEAEVRAGFRGTPWTQIRGEAQARNAPALSRTTAF